MPTQKFLVLVLAKGFSLLASLIGTTYRTLLTVLGFRKRLALLALIVIVALFSFVALQKPQSVLADSANATVNFQARLETSSGAIVPDGNYNIEFKLYDSSSGGSAEWTEDYTYDSGPSGANEQVQVVDGYLSVALGSITSFPSTINWNQNQYLTMNIGGTGTTGSFPSIGDGEMDPRLLITAIPFAFQAGQLAVQTGSYQSTLGFSTQTASNSIYLPDDNNATLCDNVNASGCTDFAAATGGGGYIQNTTSAQSTSDFNISGTGVIGDSLTTPALQSAYGSALSITANDSSTWETSSGNLTIQAADSGGSLILDAGSSGDGTVDIGNSNANDINIGNNSAGHVINIGSVSGSSSSTIQGGSGGVNLLASGASNTGVLVSTDDNSTAAFVVQNASNVAALNVDTTDLTTTIRAGTDSATLGSELNTTTDFTNAAWTSSGWSTTTTTATNTSSNTAPLSTNQFSLTNGASYQVSYTFSGSTTAGSTVAVSLGGTSVYSYTFTGNSSQDNFSDSRLVTYTTGSPSLAFTPSSNYTGSISNVSVKLVTSNNNPALVIDNASGESNLDIRASSSTSNLFVGLGSGQSNSSGTDNTALGSHSLLANTSGSDNLGSGNNALQANTSGSDNAALGSQALLANTSGSDNAALGDDALQSNMTGSEDTALGDDADVSSPNLINATAIGYGAVVSASNTVVIGSTGVSCVIIGASSCSNVSGVELGVEGIGVASGGFMTGTPDVAEYIDASAGTSADDVVVADPNNAEAVTTSATPYDPTAVGIITNGTSGFQMLNAHYGQPFNDLDGETDPNALPMAVTGRVPVKVTGEGGPIVPGDYVTTSSSAGYAMKADHAGAVIGKSLGYFSGTSSSDTGTVLVLVDLSYYDGPDPGTYVQNNGDADLSDLTISGSSNFTNLNVTGAANISNLAVQNLGDSGNLSVSGLASIATLSVSGDAQFAGDVIIGGHIVTAGNVPTIIVQTAAGQPAKNDLLDPPSSAVITGNDVTGTITITTSDNPTSGDLANITFSKTYAGLPHVLLTGQDANSAASLLYPSNESPTGFQLNMNNAPSANTTYSFDYLVID